ncbi:MAG: Fur family transcriptional regulator [Sumerlaeia bacterium]
MKQTKLTQRQLALLQIFEAAKKPLKVEDAWEAVGRTTMSMATLYRALGRLVELGHLRGIEIQNAPQMYESSKLGHHHHFYCYGCGNVFDIPKCVHNISSMVPEGFVMKDHTIIIYGECPKCN